MLYRIGVPAEIGVSASVGFESVYCTVALSRKPRDLHLTDGGNTNQKPISPLPAACTCWCAGAGELSRYIIRREGRCSANHVKG
ncbi:unnamed protein product [Ectocarpus fasciculatus]